VSASVKGTIVLRVCKMLHKKKSVMGLLEEIPGRLPTAHSDEGDPGNIKVQPRGMEEIR
jgi:hypothetical protein